MPVPTPNPSESESDFMSRCISFVIGEGLSQEQAIAICSNQWNENKSDMKPNIEIPEFGTRKELFDFLVTNKSTLIAQKKYNTKHSDPFVGHSYYLAENGAIKANAPIINPSNQLKVRAIINTTNLMDSHKDVHLPGLWDKSLQENIALMHLQEHNMSFKGIISDGDNLKAYVKTYSWKELGYDFEGKTQALVFDSTVRKDRNNFMHDQYARGFVKNHSVGMQYVRLILAINDKDYGAEYEAWEKYYPEIANKETADDSGYFWAVKEAKAIEGSAVPRGSNYATPTLENNMKSAPPEGTRTEIIESAPPKGTPKNQSINIKKLILELKK